MASGNTNYTVSVPPNEKREDSTDPKYPTLDGFEDITKPKNEPWILFNKKKHDKNKPEKKKNLLQYVKLEKSPKQTQFFVKPAAGINLPIPEFNFEADHFKIEEYDSCDVNINNSLTEDFVEVVHDNCKEISHTSPFQELDLFTTSDVDIGEISEEVSMHPNESDKAKETFFTRDLFDQLPSQTLAMSISMLKSYLTPSTEEIKSSADSPQSVNQEESVKNKVMGLWHNVKYGWSANLKTNFSHETPVYLLGKIYHRNFTPHSICSELHQSDMDGFKRDFHSLFWLTYRTKFPPLTNTSLTSDCGWGCMIRSGQMILATALRRHLLPSGWHYNKHERNNITEKIHRKIMKWFSDYPSPLCPFSIHNLVSHGIKQDKKAGDWYGPTCVAHMLKDALKSTENEILSKLGIYVAQDGAVYVQDILDTCTTKTCICSRSSNYNTMANKAGSSKIYPPLSLDSSDINLPSKSPHQAMSIDCDRSRNTSYDLSSSWVSCDTMSIIDSECATANCIDYFVDSNRATSKRPSLPYLRTGRMETMRQQCNFSNADDICDKNRSTTTTNKWQEKSFWQKDIDGICSNCQNWRSCVILIPVRLGGNSVNPIYYDNVFSLLMHDLCIGIIGGRPKHSLYFVGFQEDSLIYLDPHLSQDFVPCEGPTFPLSSFHCSSPRKLSIQRLDPSAAFGFYCHSKEHFLRLWQELPVLSSATEDGVDSSIFEFVDGSSSKLNGWIKD